jgi:hypothetical protein
MTADFIALVLQATGGAIADTADNNSTGTQGTHIMVAGLSFQVLSLLGFIAIVTDFALRVRRDRRNGSYNKESQQEMINGRSNGSFKHFLCSKSSITVMSTLLIRFQVLYLLHSSF